jgi:FKBP-type peptidyl-prolyl cis-trans isomerase FklB
MKVIKLVFVLTLVITMVSCGDAIEKKELKTEIDSASYTYGLALGSQLRVNFTEVDRNLFIQGFKNGLDSTKLLVEVKEIDNILRPFFTKKQAEQQAKMQEEALKKTEEEYAEVKLEGEKFLEANKDAEGVVTTDSGLQYIVLEEGTGVKPNPRSKVTVHYTGTLIDGTVFDSSVERGEPATFGVSQVIEGWTEGLQLMPAGSKYKFFIPQNLGYGANPRSGGVIRPFDPLIFEVELIEVSE